MKYAVIRTGGKQYRVAPGDVIRVEKLPGQVGSSVEFSEVLLAAEPAGDVRVGRPLVDGLRVHGEIIAHEKDRKVIVFKKKRRKDYRRKQGHRQELTAVKVTDIAAAATSGSTNGA